MAAEVAERVWSAEEFLEWESAQPYKHELIDNRVYEMTGASRSHNLIAGNLVTALNIGLRGKDCEVYPADMRVLVRPGSSYTYPDVVVVCGKPKFRSGIKPDTLENPTLIFEILSPTTELIDRNRKLDQYLELKSVQGYYLVSQQVPRVESYTRLGEDWLYATTSGLETSLVIAALDFEIPLSEMYRQAQLTDE